MSKISVAMTTYNGEKFLKEQLDSILAQSRPVDALVVCDDGSTDGTVSILNDFSKCAPFQVRIIVNKENLGSTKNFEKAMSFCKGDIIVLCDQDDVWLPDKVNVLESVFLTNPKCLMAFTDAIIVSETNEPCGRLWPNYRFGKKKQDALMRGDGLNFLVNGNVVTGATAAVTKAFFEKARPFPAEFIHDYWLATAAAAKGGLFFNNAVTVKYRKHPSQQIGTPPKINLPHRISGVADFDGWIGLTQTMLSELDGKFNLTEKQRELFTGKIEFYMTRKNHPHGKLARLPKISRDLLTGNYHRFASGFLSAAKDFVKNPSQNKRL